MTPPPRDGNAEPTSRRVYQEAARLFRERGYNAATTRQLSDRLGVNKASLYYHVSKKEDLLFKICVDALERVEQDALAAVARSDDAVEAIRALVHAHLSAMLSEIDMHATMMLERRQLTGERYDFVQSLQDRYQTVVRTAIEKAQKQGSLRSDLTASDMTFTLLNMLNWTITWYRPGSSREPAKLADLYWDLFLNGARASG